MKKNTLLIAIIYFIISGCTQSGEQQPSHIPITKRDTTITPQNAYSNLFLDSASVENYITSNKVDDSTANRFRSFYNSRNYQYAWFYPEGLADQTSAFWNLHQNYLDYSKDSSLQDQWLHQQMKQWTDEQHVSVDPKDSSVIKTELELTDHFFQYAKNAYMGKIDPAELQWFIPRKKVDVVELLDSLIAIKGQNLQNWEPVNKQYHVMKKELLQFYDLEKEGGWPVVDLGTKKVFKLGDSSLQISKLKQRLQMSGDMTAGDTSPLFNHAAYVGVRRAQHRYGISEDGVVGPATLSKLNVPVKDRIEQIMINMERMRWLPNLDDENYIIANIPEFALHVYEKNHLKFSINVVVGKEGHDTQVFSDKLEYVVFSPYWNIPRSIIKNEIVPGMNRNPYYLAEHNMEQTGYSNGLPIIRQKPGPDNSLGRVKFIFPNNYNIYFHDTPAKSLFSNNNRAFSHGCIRLEDPFKLAAYLLRNQPKWTDDAIWDAMYNSDTEKWVKLQKPVPVQITYFTAWVDNDGLLNFREDIYGHDTTTAQKLFNHSMAAR